MEILKLHGFAFILAIIAFVYSDVLTEPKMILNWLYRFADSKIPSFIAKPLITCFRCVAGQFALWFFIFNFEYSFALHAYFICLTIYLSVILCRIYRGNN